MKRILSGMRPTGPLHIGHWEGVIKNWVELQKEHECFFFSADWHVLTTDYQKAHGIRPIVRENVANWIAAGIDPARSVIFVQSDIKEHAELHLLLSMLVPVPWLERNPTYKEQLAELRKVHISPPMIAKIAGELKGRGTKGKELGKRFRELAEGRVEAPPEALQELVPELEGLLSEELYGRLKETVTARDLSTLGFLAYPVLQTADIIAYKATGVPVGEDQLPHVELSREIVRRFNGLYGEVFPEPKALLTPTPKLLGTDDRKMSKSYGNAVMLGDTAEETIERVKPMKTDPARRRRTDPGNPEVCNVYAWHKLYSSSDEQAHVAEQCRTAGFGCIDCKMIMVNNLNNQLEPLREKRTELLEKPEKLDRIIDEGADRARRIARETMSEVREAMKLHG